MPLSSTSKTLSRLAIPAVCVFFCLSPQALSGRASECGGGTCSPGGSSSSSTTTLASVAPGRSFSGGSSRNMERDWRTRMLLDNLAEDKQTEDEDSAGALAPIIGRQDAEPGSLNVTYSAIYRESQYSPYSDGRSANDRENSYELALEATYTVSEETELLGQLSYRHEWSQDDPEAFRHYEIDMVRFTAGVRQRLTDSLTGTLRLGSYLVDGGGTGLPPDGAPKPELLGSFELEYSADNFSLRGGSMRDVFASPDRQGYKLARIYLNYADANIQLSEKLNLNLRGSQLRFTDDTENYETLGVVATYYPSLKHHIGLSAGVVHEFRARDETILTGGIEWMQPFSGRNSLLASARYNANTTTDEREIVSEIAFGRTSQDRRHGAAVGVSFQYEYRVYDHYSTLVFLRLY